MTDTAASVNTPAPADPERARFFQRLAQAAASGEAFRLVMSRLEGTGGGLWEGLDTAGLQRLQWRPVVLKGQPHWSVLHRHSTRDETYNHSPEVALQRLACWLGKPGFRSAHLSVGGETWQLDISKKGKALVSRQRAAAAAPEDAAVASDDRSGGGAGVDAPAGAHDRAKVRWVDQQQPFLQALGVTDARHAVVPAMARKWKQINKFVEVFARAVQRAGLDAATGPRPLRVADFGAGRGYLTFAVHDWLRAQGLQPEVIGVELRQGLVDEAEGSIRALGLQGLRFEAGDVREWSAAEIAPDGAKHLNVVIALHACDTATDHAIHLGLRAGAEVIVCSPCCHQQLRPQLLSPHPLRPVFSHGIHAEQQAEMLTDSLRALLLESQGYDTQVFEFVALEHTRKNKMILGVRRPGGAPRSAAALQQLGELKTFFGIRDQALESLLRADGRLPAQA